MPFTAGRPFQRQRLTPSVGAPVRTINIPVGGPGGYRSAGGRRRRRPSLIRQLANDYRNQINSANQANENRYNQILQGYDDLHARSMGAINQLGAQQRSDIDERYDHVNAANQQNLIARGFGNSTIPATMRMGVSRERNRDHNRLRDALVRERVGVDSGLTQGKLGVIERRQDVGPDPAQLAALMQQLGQAGYGQQSYNQAGYGGPAMAQAGLQQGIQNYFQGVQRHRMMPFQLMQMFHRGPWQLSQAQRNRHASNRSFRRAVRGVNADRAMERARRINRLRHERINGPEPRDILFEEGQ